MAEAKETRSFILPRDPSVDRRFRPRPERQVNLFNVIMEDESVDELEQGSDTTESHSLDSVSQVEGTSVYLRLRPVDRDLSANYQVSGNVLVTKCTENSVNNKNVVEKHFTFTDIFESSVEQNQIYENSVRGSIEASKDLTVLTYGTSGSGKTYTLLGNYNDPGIISRSLENIFELFADNICAYPAVKMINSTISVLDDTSVKKEEELRNKFLPVSNDVVLMHNNTKRIIHEQHKFKPTEHGRKTVFIWISFVEIYNEVVCDLLNPSQSNTLKKNGLKIIANDGNVFVKNLTSVFVKSSLEAYNLLVCGLKRVNYASTAVNANSSRSHCIFLVDVITFSHPDVFFHHTYRFCDLAGSERIAKTGNTGDRLKEAQRIHTSLLVLGRCIDVAYNNQLKKNSDLIPYRESKLTMLLQAPLMGKEKMVFIVNVSPLDNYLEENLNVLSFSSIAKSLVYKEPNKKHRKSARYSIAVRLTGNFMQSSTLVNTSEAYDLVFEENITLKSEIEDLREQLSQLEYRSAQDLDYFERRTQESNLLWEERLTQQQKSLMQQYEAKISRYEATIQDLRAELAELYQEIEETKPVPANQFEVISDDENDDTRSDDENDGTRSDDENDGTRSDDENDGTRSDDENDGTRSDDENDSTRSDDENDGTRSDDNKAD